MSNARIEILANPNIYDILRIAKKREFNGIIMRGMSNVNLLRYLFNSHSTSENLLSFEINGIFNNKELCCNFSGNITNELIDIVIF